MVQTALHGGFQAFRVSVEEMLPTGLKSELSPSTNSCKGASPTASGTPGILLDLWCLRRDICDPPAGSVAPGKRVP